MHLYEYERKAVSPETLGVRSLFEIEQQSFMQDIWNSLIGTLTASAEW